MARFAGRGAVAPELEDHRDRTSRAGRTGSARRRCRSRRRTWSTKATAYRMAMRISQSITNAAKRALMPAGRISSRMPSGVSAVTTESSTRGTLIVLPLRDLFCWRARFSPNQKEIVASPRPDCGPRHISAPLTAAGGTASIAPRVVPHRIPVRRKTRTLCPASSPVRAAAAARWRCPAPAGSAAPAAAATRSSERFPGCSRIRARRWPNGAGDSAC